MVIAEHSIFALEVAVALSDEARVRFIQRELTDETIRCVQPIVRAAPVLVAADQDERRYSGT